MWQEVTTPEIREGFVDLDNDVYRQQTDWVSISELNLFREAPVMYEWRVLKGNRSASNRAQEVGIAVHAAVLEPHIFKAEYARLSDDCDLRTSQGKSQKAAIEARGVKALKAEDWDACIGASDKVYANRNAAELLAHARTEQSYFWIDEATGVKCKARADAILMPQLTVIDLKTTRDPKNFLKSVMDYGYHRQAAHYLDGLTKITDQPWTEYYWVAVHPEPPHLVQVYKASYRMLQAGREEVRETLARFKECRESNTWPGLSEEVIELDLPSWHPANRNNVTL